MPVKTKNLRYSPATSLLKSLLWVGQRDRWGLPGKHQGVRWKGYLETWGPWMERIWRCHQDASHHPLPWASLVGVALLLAEVPGHVGLPEAIESVQPLGKALCGLQIRLLPIGQGICAPQGQPLGAIQL